MTKTALWMSAGVLSLVASVGMAGETATLTPIPTPTDKAAAGPAISSSVDCNPCAEACDPCCPKPPKKWKQACAAPAKIIVHQAEPIVEFRNTAPSSSSVATSGGRPIISDRCVRPVGGEGHGAGCGCNQGGAGG